MLGNKYPRDSLSSGERKGISPNLYHLGVIGVVGHA
jgi:hypothetical protein